MLKTILITACVCATTIKFSGGLKCYSTQPQGIYNDTYTSVDCRSGVDKCLKVICDKDTAEGEKVIGRDCMDDYGNCSYVVKDPYKICKVAMECYTCDSDNCNRAQKMFMSFVTLAFAIFALVNQF